MTKEIEPFIISNENVHEVLEKVRNIKPREIDFRVILSQYEYDRLEKS